MSWCVKKTTGRLQAGLAPMRVWLHLFRMSQKEIVLEAVRELPDDCSMDEIADRVEFLAAVQKGFDQLDRGEGIPHDEVKKQLASWLAS